MTKPKTLTVAQEGTKTHTVLEYFLDRPDLKFPNISDAMEHLAQELIEIDRRTLSGVISSYNEGLYEVNGVTSKTQQIAITPHQESNLQSKELQETTLELPFTDGEDVTLKDFRTRCEEAGIDPTEARGGWLKEKGISVRMDIKVDEVKQLNENMEKARKIWAEEIQPKARPCNELYDQPDGRVGVVNVTDLHLGAYVQGLHKTPEYSKAILCESLERVAEQVNRLNYSKVYVNLLGDLIESLGMELAHPSMWKELENGIYGYNAIKLCYTILDEHLLGKITNLEEINLIAGNHDRGTADRSSDTEGLAAQAVADCLKLKGYKVDFDSLVLSKEIDGINYVLLHGDKTLSKRATKDIAWDHGKQGMFNFVLEGHLHSRTEKVSATREIKTKTDDAQNSRRIICPSIFTGNRYSEYGGWDALGGFNIIENNGSGKPNVFDFAL